MTERIERLTAMIPRIGSETELTLFAFGLLTDDEWTHLKRYYAYVEWQGAETETPAPGMLTTRESQIIRWFRQQEPADRAALETAFLFVNDALNLYNGSGLTE